MMRSKKLCEEESIGATQGRRDEEHLGYGIGEPELARFRDEGQDEEGDEVEEEVGADGRNEVAAALI